MTIMETAVDLETRRAIVEACYGRHGHKVLSWLTNRAVPVHTEKTRDDAVDGDKVWAAAVMELHAELSRRSRARS